MPDTVYDIKITEYELVVLTDLAMLALSDPRITVGEKATVAVGKFHKLVGEWVNKREKR